MAKRVGIEPEDPGWRPILRRLPLVLIFPAILFWRAFRHQRTGPHILALRAIFLAYLMGIIYILSVLPQVLPLRGTGGQMIPAIVLLCAGSVVTIVGTQLVCRYSLPCKNEATLRATYGVISFIGIACAEAAAMSGFIAGFIVGGFGPYLVGLVVSLIGFLMVAPTRRAVHRRDRQLASRDCGASLRNALYLPLPHPGSSRGRAG